MAIDLRATIQCGLGPVISASISDDYIQGSGLIKTSGTCKIKGVVTPAQGEIVVFTYTKNGITRRVPRTLRVLSFFADPFRKTTDVQLGCLLTYMQDKKDPTKLEPLDDPANKNRLESEKQIVTIPIYAKSIAARCLNRIGIVANSLPLTNRFSVSEFDLSSGYVNVLSDLLVSESLYGYLDESEILRIDALDAGAVSGPLVTSADLVDAGPIAVGGVPGDTVAVSYSTLRLKPPEDEAIACKTLTPEEEEQLEEQLEEETEEELNPIEVEPDETGDEPAEDPGTNETQWGDDLATSFSEQEVAITYTNPGTEEPAVEYYNVLDTSQQTTTYQVYSFQNEDGSITRKNVPTIKIRTETKSSASVLGSIASQYLSGGFEFANAPLETVTTETFTYDKYGNEIKRETYKVGDRAFEVGSLGFDFVVEEASGDDVTTIAIVIPYGITIPIELTVVDSVTAFGVTSSYTRRFVRWSKTVYGQQAISAAKEIIDNSQTPASATLAAIDAIADRPGLFLQETQGETSRTGYRGEGASQQAPLPEDIVNSRYSENSTDNKDDDIGALEAEEEGESQSEESVTKVEVDPTNGYSTLSVSEIEFATGSPLSTRRVEFTMPYAPDDVFVRRLVSTNPTRYCYYSFRSDAAYKASRYGRIQNRMLMGNRHGLSIQLSPEKVPNKPFSSFFLQAAGTIALYRTNACSWTMDSNGIIVSVEAMYWGVAGAAS